jgi:predicted AlkP superfamily phosphohydrolase/phosphomutase
MSKFKQVFILGVSGATPTIIEPLLNKGLLPNFQRLRDYGYWGKMLSVRSQGDKHFRPQVAWPTLATGQLPENHNITKFYCTTEDLKGLTLWDIYENNGFSIGLYGWPLTWPPRPINGFIVPSYLARDTQTWPPELSIIRELNRSQQQDKKKLIYQSLLRFEELLKLIQIGWQYQPSLPTVSLLFQNFFRLQLSSSIEERNIILRDTKTMFDLDLFLRLYYRFKPSFTTFHTFLVDFVSHRYWRYYDTSSFPEEDKVTRQKFALVLEDAYKRVDYILGKMLNILPENSLIAVVSEHGMEAEINTPEVGFWHYLIKGTKLIELVEMEDQLISCPIARWIAFLPKNGPFIASDIAKVFSSIKVVETGLPLFQVYEHGSQEVIIKFQLDLESYSIYPNLESLNIQYKDKVFPFSTIARKGNRVRSGMHSREGIVGFIAKGMDKPQNVLLEMNLIDFAPTLLKACDLPIPSEMTGTAFPLY